MNDLSSDKIALVQKPPIPLSSSEYTKLVEENTERVKMADIARKMLDDREEQQIRKSLASLEHHAVLDKRLSLCAVYAFVNTLNRGLERKYGISIDPSDALSVLRHKVIEAGAFRGIHLYDLCRRPLVLLDAEHKTVLTIHVKRSRFTTGKKEEVNFVSFQRFVAYVQAGLACTAAIDINPPGFPLHAVAPITCVNMGEEIGVLVEDSTTLSTQFITERHYRSHSEMSFQVTRMQNAIDGKDLTLPSVLESHEAAVRNWRARPTDECRVEVLPASPKFPDEERKKCCAVM